MEHHHLKSIPKHFAALKKGTRTAEVRYADRPYAVGDGITFYEFENEVVTGNTQTALISHLDDFGCQFGYVNISLGKLGCLIQGC